ncbi:MAG: hypothetical protein AAF762_02600 [Pseudomonadota bacterium]
MAKKQRDAFDQRLNRIKKGAPNTMGEIEIGPREEVRAGKRSKRSSTVRMKRKEKKVNLGEGSNWVMVPTAFVVGGFSMFVGGAAAYHLFGGGLFPVEVQVAAIEPYLPYANIAIAALLGLFFTWSFGFTNKKRKVALALGLIGALYFEGDLIQRYAGSYAAMYSPDYVAAAPEPKWPTLTEDLMNRVPGLMERAQEIADGVTSG